MKSVITFFVAAFMATTAMAQTAPKQSNKYMFNNVRFTPWKSEIVAEDAVELDRLVTLLKKETTLKVEFVGHTDNIGAADANQKLSESRAKAVYDYVANKGIAADRLSFKGMGGTKPITANDATGRKKNRRVEIVVIE